ncbi:Cytoplasmic tRNA 2-thiolation protein 1 [Bienertia sinuspersici]
MAEDLDDGEFWLPSHFLTDDDILMDFDFSATKPEQVPGQGMGMGMDGFSSNSDLELTSGCTETESDEEDLLHAGLTREMTRSKLNDSSPSCPVHSKGMVLSSSPQSTLCGCVCNQGSSRESLSGPVSPPKSGEKGNSTLDLLNKAAGEVARLKMMKTEKTTTTGTGFFDCSQKGILYPAPLRNPDHFPPLYFQPHLHHFPPMVWAQSNGLQYNPPKQPPSRGTKNNTNNKSSSNNGKNGRPLGLPPSAWPPLQPQAQNQAQNPAHVGSMFAGPKKECAGTGVFLPRRVSITPSDTRNKSGTLPFLLFFIQKVLCTSDFH